VRGVKISFAVIEGNIATGVRFVPNLPEIVNLRADPYEKAPHESLMYFRWFGDLLWLFVPLQHELQAFLMTMPSIPSRRD
jgi:hypothetical protein